MTNDEVRRKQYAERSICAAGFGRSSFAFGLWSFVIRHTTPIKEVT
jgi:hypothetical protein